MAHNDQAGLPRNRLPPLPPMLSSVATIPLRYFPIRRRALHYLNATPETFHRQIANKHRITLVDFYADWCGPCKALTPVLKKLTSESHPNIDLVTIDTDQHQDLALRYKIASIPTVIAFRDAQPVSKFVGALPESQLVQFLSNL